MTRLFDNIHAQLGAHLQLTLDEFETMDVAVGYFNLRGWRVFADRIDARSSQAAPPPPVSRILIGMVVRSPQDEALDDLQRDLEGRDEPSDLIDNPTALDRRALLIKELGEQLTRGLPNAADRHVLRQLRDQVASGAVEVKVHTRRPLHGKTYVFHRTAINNSILAFVGSSNLTASGLSSNYELNVDVVDSDGAQALADWFTDRWDDPRSLAIGADLLTLIDESWAGEQPRPPYEVYLKLCYDLSRDVRDGLAEYSLTGPINSVLLDYQREAVQTLARRIMNRGGTMLGDVVGLGKTLTAIAVSLLLRDEYGYSTLVVCPKNLVGMWKDHLHAYQVHGDVVPYSMAKALLPGMRRYQFVIVDESHTMRNPDRQDYIALHRYIRDNESKVMLLTATPYNVGFDDVAAQLGLWIDEDDDLGLQPSAALAKDASLRDRVDGKTSTLQAFKKSQEPEDWKRLMSEHLVRRTRGFIKNKALAAGSQDERGIYLTFADGRKFYFPKRIPKPLQHSFKSGDPAVVMAADTTLDALAHLELPRYDLSQYLAKGVKYSPDEQSLIDDWRRSRGQVAGFVRTNFYKRLSSCGYSFVLSITRHIDRNNLFLYALNSGQAVPTGTVLDSMFEPSGTDEDFDADSTVQLTTFDQYANLVARNPTSITWVRPELFTGELRVALEHDTQILADLLASFGDWSPATDSKLKKLIQLVTKTHPDQKILIFTEYKDTADYLKTQLDDANIAAVGLATGDSADPTALAHRFSPRSNTLIGEEPRELQIDDPIRVLIATDVLSEGQNLQDSHIVVNYDLPWAIIKLIQRAGRVDRVGQESDEVLVYSFFHESLEGVLSLRQRIARRLEAAAKAFGSDEQFFGTATEIQIITDLYNGTLDDPDDNAEVDAASQAYEVWNTATTGSPELAQRISALPDLLHSTRPGPPPTGLAPGLGCFIRTSKGFDAYGYAQHDGQLQLVTGQEILRIFACEPTTPGQPDRADQDDLLASLVRGEHAPLAKPQSHEGQLKGVRKRVWLRLTGTFDATPDVNEALDALHRDPLTHEAERKLRKSLAAGNLAELADLVSALHRDDRLVTRSDGTDPVRIVSSMGITS